MAGILSFLSFLSAHQLTVSGSCNRQWLCHPCLLIWQEIVNFSHLLHHLSPLLHHPRSFSTIFKPILSLRSHVSHLSPSLQIRPHFNPEPSPGSDCQASCSLLLNLQMPPLLNSTSCFLSRGIPTGGSLGQKCCSQTFSLFTQLTHRV